MKIEKASNQITAQCKEQALERADRGGVGKTTLDLGIVESIRGKQRTVKPVRSKTAIT